MTVCSTCKHANYCEIVAGGYSSQVKSCRDYRKGETTNEEWLRSATTEELEEEILAWWVDGADTYSHFGLFKHEIDGAKEKIVKWLKEKHE